MAITTTLQTKKKKTSSNGSIFNDALYKKYTTYAPSANTKAAQKQVNALEKQGAPTYQSQYTDQINALMDKIVNRKDFSYDFNADPLYQQYKDNYTALGAQAAQNVTASAAGMTGGYGNSYAATAASQANQQYLNQLNNVIPDLYNAAMNKYNAETENLYNQFNMYGQQEDRAFGQYQTQLNQYNADRDYYYNKYSNSVGNDQWRSQFDASNYQWGKEYDFSREQWEWQKAQAKKSGGGSGSGRSKSSVDDTTTSGGTTDHEVYMAKQAKKMLEQGFSTDNILQFLKDSGEKYGLGDDVVTRISKKIKLQYNPNKYHSPKKVDKDGNTEGKKKFQEWYRNKNKKKKK